MSVQNIAVKLCGVLQSQSEEEVTAREWRLLGQEEDGTQVLSWVSTKDDNEVLNIGVYTNKTKSLVILHTFEEKLNIIQASVNASHSLLVYSVKQLPTEESEIKEPLYCPYLICLLPDKDRTPQGIEEGSTKQIMVQYVYGKSNKYSPGIRNDRFLLFKHLEYIKVYRSPLFLNECEDGSERWGFDGVYTDPETVVKVFSWAQWDATNQVLYYIHYRAPAQSFAEEEVKSPCDVSPTLSALQFHADLPHETVLNIPLSLPHLHASSSACGAYEDDPVPLRIHDCSLDLSIACRAKGVLCVMHHYLYKPLDDSTTSLVLEDSADVKDSGVNFAYSVTVLQHGCVIHSVLPDLPWTLAKALRPSHTLYNDDHLLVHIPHLFTHLLDISPDHAPGSHIVLPCDDAGAALAPLLGWGPHAMVDLSTLDVVTLSISEKDLVSAFKNTVTENKIAIVHYLVEHEGNTELAEQLISWLCLNQRPKDGDVFVRVMQEYLIASAFSLTRRSLPASAVPLLDYLPSVLQTELHDVRVRDVCVSVSQEQLWCGASVVLAPRQRVCQFSEDAWTRLWRRLSVPAPARADPQAVSKRLAMTMHCYQPEALSRGSTPLSPLAPGGGLGALSGLPAPRRSSVSSHDALPFVELDVCTASRQEHVTAANLRAISTHLLRGLGGGGGGGGGAGACGAGGAGRADGVHAAATRYVSAQLDAARALCRALCRAVGASTTHQKGFAFIEEMEATHALIVFKVLEQYYLACVRVSFPLPAGFSSWFARLAHRALPFPALVGLVHRGVLEMQIDVMKDIIATKDTDERTVNNKLRLIQLIGEGRARRTLAAWPHRAALVLRAREHAAALLSGAGAPAAPRERRPKPHEHGIAALPSGERLSPLDTFLDLLTAKASLNELDFNLIIEATLALVQQDAAN
ncbi:protein pigeon [Cydia fagiglandana]|uniref:protein pigeon n=1 Tax=Cydia fagiglandana TaxID=1458189 RepID=UPI002FEE3BD3